MTVKLNGSFISTDLGSSSKTLKLVLSLRHEVEKGSTRTLIDCGLVDPKINDNSLTNQ